MSEVPQGPAQPGSAESGERSRREVPWRFAILVLCSYIVVGALCGVLWEWLWTPPAQFVQQHQLYYADYSALRRVFDGTGIYVVVAAFASALVALVVCVLTRRHELVTLGLVIVGSVLAAFVMREVGYALGPPDPAIAAATAADGAKLQGQLQVAGLTPLLVWPMASLFMVALTFFAWPGHPHGPDWDTHDEPALPADRQRLVDHIRSARFTPVRIRQGYEMTSVDALLDRAAEAAGRGEPLGPLLDVELPTVHVREGYDMAQVNAFFDGLRESADDTETRG